MEMYCGKCNKEVKEDMAFCPYCGAQIEKETDTEIKETYTRQEEFELLGNTLIFSQPEASRAWVHQGFMYLFNEVQQKILDIGDLVVKGTCEDYPQRIMEVLFGSIEQAEDAKQRVVDGILYETKEEAKRAQEKIEQERNMNRYGTNDKEKIEIIKARIEKEQQKIKMCKKLIANSCSEVTRPLYFYSVLAKQKFETQEGRNKVFEAECEALKVYREASKLFSKYSTREKKEVLEIVSFKGPELSINMMIDDRALPCEVLVQIDEIFEEHLEIKEPQNQKKLESDANNGKNLDRNQDLNMRLCENCGKMISQTAKFCNFCGAIIEKKIDCPKCGKKIRAQTKYCNFCGEKIEM